MGDNTNVPMRDSGIQIMPTPRDVSAVNPYCCRMKRDHKVKVCTTERDFFMPPMDPWRMKYFPCYRSPPLDINLYIIPQQFPPLLTTYVNQPHSYRPLSMQTMNPALCNQEDKDERGAMPAKQRYDTGHMSKGETSGDLKQNHSKRKLFEEIGAENGVRKVDIANEIGESPASKRRNMSISNINDNIQRKRSQLSNKFSSETFAETECQTGGKRSSFKSTEKELKHQRSDGSVVVANHTISTSKRKSKTSNIDKTEDKEFGKWKKMSDNESHSVAFQNFMKPVSSVTYSEKTNRSFIQESEANSRIFSQSSYRDVDWVTPYKTCYDMSEWDALQKGKPVSSDYKLSQRSLKYHDYHVKINYNSTDRISKGKGVYLGKSTNKLGQ